MDISITTVKNDSGHQATYHAKTRPLFEPIYPVDNRYSVSLDPRTVQPYYYRKEIQERSRTDNLWARYDSVSQRILYSNGLTRSWQGGGHNLFSALQWVQQHDWEVSEKQVLVVEIEGVFWEVSLQCSESMLSRQSEERHVEVLARFEKKIAGEPVLSSTDILTYMLPGEGNRLRMGLDPKKDIVSWIEFGAPPFHVRAELNPGAGQP